SAVGATVNTMVLAGLVIAPGGGGDDAIIDVENIAPRLRQEAKASNPRPALEGGVGAWLGGRSAAAYAALDATLWVRPGCFLGGLAGWFFRPLALSSVRAVGASLFIALTLTRALSLMLLPGRTSARHESPLTHWLRQQYRTMLPALIHHPRWCLAALALVF